MRRAIVIVPQPSTGYTARDTLYGRMEGKTNARVTFRFDTLWRVDTVVRRGMPGRVGPVRVPVPTTVVRVDTVRVVVVDTLIRRQTVTRSMMRNRPERSLTAA